MNLNSDHFTLFGLKQQFAVDTAALDAAYRQIQSQVHPDRFAQASDTEKRLALQWATHANEAYQTLKHPISRHAICYSLPVSIQPKSKTPPCRQPF